MIVTGEWSAAECSGAGIWLVLVVGIIHTGVAYALYFGCMSELKAQTVAVFSYVDPMVAIFLSAFLLKENIDVLTWIGAVMILGASVCSEFNS